MNYLASNVNRITRTINKFVNSSNTKGFDNVYWTKTDKNGEWYCYNILTPIEKWDNDIKSFQNKKKFERSFLPFGLALLQFTPKELHY